MKEQIEEMAKVICENIDRIDGLAEALYNAGYRKQSGWISVEERLPTWEDGKVMIYTPYGISIAQKTTTNHWKGDNAIPKLITHWMPLPEPPKMKGANDE